MFWCVATSLRVIVDGRQIPQVRLQLDETNDSSNNNADGDIWSSSHQDGRLNVMPSLDPIPRKQIANTLTVDNPGVKTNRRGSYLAARDIRFRSLADVTDTKLVGVRDEFAGHSLGLHTIYCMHYVTDVNKSMSMSTLKPGHARTRLTLRYVTRQEE